MVRVPHTGILVEAEAFDDLGGWIVDSQWELEMRSPYLLAHGNGFPVVDASTQVSISSSGLYHVWVRAKDWVPGHHPGRFTLSVDGSLVPREFGASGQDWSWEYGGRIKLAVGEINIVLHDLTGFGSRCDAILMSQEDGEPPNDPGETSRAWRKALLGLPESPVVLAPFDVVVVGGGIPGSAAALVAARLGERVALIQNRPGLGGNGSVHHGNTLFFRTPLSDEPSPFPQVPWATEIARDYSSLEGQLVKAGIDNGEGPVVVPPPASIPRRMKLPMTHLWEYGQHLDMYTKGEHIRDHLLRALYGTLSNVKTSQPDLWRNLRLDHVAFVTATGEFLRYKGAHVLPKIDIRSHASFADSVVLNDGAFCLHYPGHERYDFRLKYWGWDERDSKPYAIPFRCLYSTNIANLMMAGKHISVTHVAGSSTKFMGNEAQHAIATACAAYLCRKHKETPRGLYSKHLAELKALCMQVTATGANGIPSRL